MPEEAHLERVGSGLAPVSDGWFVVNAREATWLRSKTFGLRCVFECNGPVARSRDNVAPLAFPQLGFTLAVLQPGQPSTLYHAETAQEDFLVVAGSCVVTIEGEQRELHAWDFVHCPPGTAHSFAGAGDGPCVLVAVGARLPDHRLHYVPTPLAESVPEETDSPTAAYRPYGHWTADGASPL